VLRNQIKYFLLALLALLLNACSYQDDKALVITETCYKNLSIIQDENGDFEDWIKVQNQSDQAIQLQDFYLSDNDNPKKYLLPKKSLAPQEDCLIFASGKDKFDDYHWNTIINADDEWKYNSLDDLDDFDWIESDFNDGDWKSGSGGFGFGDDDDETVTEGKYGLCLRKEFEIDTLAEVKEIVFHIDFDDAFIAYINGSEIARSENLGDTFDSFFELSSPKFQREARMYRGGKPEQFWVAKESWKKHLTEGINTLSILVVNIKLKSSDISAIPYLSIATNKKTSNLPDWWELEKAGIHANFKLSKKEKITLANKHGKVVDSLRLIKTDYNHSIIKTDTAIYILDQPTNAKKDKKTPLFSCYNKVPKLSHASGFYENAIWLKSSEINPNNKFYYTLDGSIPDTDDLVLTDSLLIDSTCVLRLKAFGNGCHLSKTKNFTFLIDAAHDLPVASLIVEPDELWNEDDGIYVNGRFANSKSPFEGANFYNQKEVLANFTFFDKFQQKQIQQDIGLKIHGGGSRTRPMKSLRLTARSIYGKSSIDHSFFGDTSILKRKIILLKNAGQNFNETHLTDALLHKIVEKTGNIDIQNYEPCIVYLNGEYWGIHNIREKIGKHYLAEHYGFPKDEFDILGGSGRVALEGSDNGFYKLTKFVLKNDMSLQTNFEKFEKMVNLDNLIDYFSVNIYTINKDWRRINNVKFWRHEKHNDGKWQFFLVDGDMTLGKRSEYSEDHLDFVWTNGFRHFKVFRKLVNENENFRIRFINRYSELMESIFTPQFIIDNLNAMVQRLDSEMPAHFEKWNNTDYDRWGSDYDEWNSYIQDLKVFVENRPGVARENLVKHFDKGENDED